MSDVIHTRGLRKRYGRTRALDGLDLSVEAGRIHGFLGPNGAGKTTTIRILLGLARKTSGEATVFGRDPWRDAVALHRRLAYVPGDVSVWPNLSGGEAIDLLARLRGARTGDAAYRAERERLSLVVADTAPALYFGTRVRFKSVQAARAGAPSRWHAARR